MSPLAAVELGQQRPARGRRIHHQRDDDVAIKVFDDFAPVFWMGGDKSVDQARQVGPYRRWKIGLSVFQQRVDVIAQGPLRRDVSLLGEVDDRGERLGVLAGCQFMLELRLPQAMAGLGMSSPSPYSASLNARSMSAGQLLMVSMITVSSACS